MPYIEGDKISFGYGRGKKIINNISINIFKEDVTAVIGHNGGGKTTLGKLLAGILKPISGEILICKENTRELSLGQVGKRIGYLFQNPGRQIFTSTVEEELLFINKLMDKLTVKVYEEMERILQFFDLDSKRNELTFNLSYGEKQRLALSAILMNKPEFLILDEPTTGLDKLRKNKLSQYLKELKQEGVGMIIISHDLDFIDIHATRKIEIVRGEIADDTG